MERELNLNETINKVRNLMGRLGENLILENDGVKQVMNSVYNNSNEPHIKFSMRKDVDKGKYRLNLNFDIDELDNKSINKLANEIKSLGNFRGMNKERTIARGVVIKESASFKTMQCVFQVTCVRPMNEESADNMLKGSIERDSGTLKSLSGFINVLKKYGKTPSLDAVVKNTVLLLHYSNQNNLKSGNDIDAMIEEYWAKLCDLMGPDEVKERLANLRINNNDGIYGHQYSILNKLRVIAQGARVGKNPTFIDRAENWSTYFNRIVKDDATPYQIVVKTDDKATNKLINDYLKSHPKFGPDGKPLSAAELKKRHPQTFNELSISLSTDSSGIFKYAVFFDVEDTELLTDENGNPMEDVWTNSLGYSNNLNGTLNSYTQNYIAQLASDSKTDVEGDGETNGTEEVEYTEAKKAYEASVAICERLKIDSVKVPKKADDIDYERATKNMIRNMCDYWCMRAGIAKPSNRSILVNQATWLLLNVLNIKDNDVTWTGVNGEHRQTLGYVCTNVLRSFAQILHKQKKEDVGMIGEALQSVVGLEGLVDDALKHIDDIIDNFVNNN